MSRVLCLFFFALLFCRGLAAEPADVTLLLKWDNQFQFAGFYAAQWQGFYQEEGLNVKIIPRVQPDGSLLDLPAMMAAGTGDFAIGGPDILQLRDDGLPFVLLACLFQRSPFAFVVPANSHIRTPSDMANARIGTSKDFGFFELRSLFKHEGVGVGAVRWQPYHFALQGLIDGEEDVSIDYQVSADWASYEKKFPVRFIASEDFGLNFYGDLIYTSKRMINEKPAVVAAFVRASLRGWEYALEHADEISQRISNELPRVYKYSDMAAFNRHQAEIIRRLMNYPTTTIGHVNLSRWEKIHLALKDIGVVKGEFDSKSFYFSLDDLNSDGYQNWIFWSVLGVFLFGLVVLSLVLERKSRVSKFRERDFKSAVHMSGGIMVRISPEKQSIWLSRWIDGSDIVGSSIFSFSDFSNRTEDSEFSLVWLKGLPESMHYSDAGFVFDVAGDKKFFNLKVNESAEESGVLIGIMSDVTPQYKYKMNLEYLNAELDGRVNEALMQYRMAISDLEQTKYMLQTVLDTLPVSVFWKDKEGGFLGCNVAFARDAGITSSAQVQGLTNNDMPWSEEEKRRCLDEENSVLEGGGGRIGLDEKRILADGSIRHLKFSRIPLLDSENRVEGVLGVYQDVTSEYAAMLENQQKTSLLAAVNGRLLSVLNSSPDIIFFKDYADSEGQYLGCNKSFEEWVGLGQEEIVGRTDVDIFPPDKAKTYQDEDMNILMQGRRITKEGWLVFSSGRKVFMETVKAPIYDENNHIVGVLGIGRDNTARRQAESLYRTIYSVSHDAYLLIDAKGAIESCNRAAVKLLGGITETDLLGLFPIKDLSPEEQADGVSSRIKVKEYHDILNEKGTVLFDWVHKKISGELVYTQVFLVRLSGDNDGHIFVQLHNLTDRVERQNQLEYARRLAEEADKAKSGFLANISHEIRTPLNAILGFAQLAVHNKDNVGAYVDRINKSAKQLLGIINDTLDFAKIESGKFDLELREFDLQSLVEDVSDLYSVSAQIKKIYFSVENHVGHFYCRGDDVRIKQILSNLLSNAIKFTQSGEVKFSIFRTHGSVVFNVEDQGIGMNPEQLDKLFKPFSQADVSTTRIFGGTGLGLSIVKKLVEMMNGEISVSSQEGRGSCFSVSLPLSEVIMPVVANTAQDCPDLTGKCLLLVEDNEINQIVAQEMLASTNAHIVTCNNGLEAVEYLQGHEVDLVIMDIQMPVMDGYEATRRIRQRFTAVELPVIAMTANAMVHERQEGMACGMNDYVTKPIDQGLLYAVLATWLA